MTTMQSENIKLKLERLIEAPRERVFKAWTDPEQIKQWFVPCEKAGEVTTPSAKCDGIIVNFALFRHFLRWSSLTGQRADSLVHFRACGNVAKSLAAKTKSFTP